MTNTRIAAGMAMTLCLAVCIAVPASAKTVTEVIAMVTPTTFSTGSMSRDTMSSTSPRQSRTETARLRGN